MEKRRYTQEFRQQAVDLADSLGNAGDAAQRLGIPVSNIHNWKSRMKMKPSGKTPSEAGTLQAGTDTEELARLRRENAELKKVNHILKAAAAFFSQDHLK